MPEIQSQRRTGGSSSRRGFSATWARFWKRFPPGLVASLVFTALLLLGIYSLLRGGNRHILLGVIAGSIGLTGLGMHIWLWWKRFQDDRKARAAFEMKAETKRVRRERHSEEDAERRRRAEIDAAAREKAKEAQNAQRRASTNRAMSERAYRRGREEAIARDAMRLLAMSEITLMDAASEGFTTRGFTVDRATNDMRHDMILRDEDGAIRIVARLSPLGRKAEVADVDGLETWRSEAGAAAGILICINGFTSEAVQRAATLPATLAEAHLLAQWRVGRDLSGNPSVELIREEDDDEYEDD